MPAPSALDNFQAERGYGDWEVVVYAPESRPCPVIRAFMAIGKDFHVFYLTDTKTNERKYIASFPSQNVAYVRDTKYVPGND